MVRIAIVEDEQSYRDTLTEYLHRFEQESGQLIQITAYTDGDSIVSSYKAQFDIILMDVEMRFMDGMSAAEEIRRIDQEVVIIFITNMAQYAIRGYEVDALDYVLKPVSYFVFAQKMSRALRRMKNRETRTFSLETREGTVRLDLSELFYIESQGHKLLLHTAGGIYEATGTMKELEQKLAPEKFFRGNKGYLINLAHVDSVRDGCAVVRGDRLLLSRARKKDFMEALTRYWGEVSK